jgi:hypothetical protein
VFLCDISFNFSTRHDFDVQNNKIQPITRSGYDIEKLKRYVLQAIIIITYCSSYMSGYSNLLKIRDNIMAMHE